MSHNEKQQRWDQLSEEMRRGNPSLFDPTKINIPMSASARIRFEPNSRDAMNSRIWESIKYDTKAPSTEVIKTANSANYMDMNPISSRKSQQNYIQEQQFFPDPPRPSKPDEVPLQLQQPSQQSPGFNNPYMQRLDPVKDNRNIPREMRSAVYEDNREREIDSSRILSERQFSYRYLPEDEAAKAAAIQAYELLRPKTDDYTKQFSNH
jgi:hypothetical protein